MRAALRREDGVTLPELLVTMVVLGIIAGASINVWLSSQRVTSTVTTRRDTLNDMRFAMNLMTKQGRQATKIYTTTDPTKLDMNTYINGVSHRVVYQATSGTLTRRLDGGAATPLVGDLDSDSVFTFTVAENVVQEITIRLAVDTNEGPLSMRSEIETRNL